MYVNITIFEREKRNACVFNLQCVNLNVIDFRKEYPKPNVYKQRILVYIYKQQCNVVYYKMKKKNNLKGKLKQKESSIS